VLAIVLVLAVFVLQRSETLQLGFMEMMTQLYLLKSFLKLAQISVKFQRDVVEVVNVITEFGAQNISRKQFFFARAKLFPYK
jgi:hypothetical protein